MPQWIPVLGLAGLLGAAPGPHQSALQAQAQDTMAQDTIAEHGVSLDVKNDNFHLVTIYAVRPGFRQRIGDVNGLGKGTFQFSWPDGDMRFEVRLLAVGSYYTEIMNVQQGDALQLTVLPYLHTLPPGTVF